MANLSVYAGEPVQPSHLAGDLRHFNITLEAAKSFGMHIAKAADDPRSVVMVAFRYPNGDSHTERQKPYCLAGDRPKTADDVSGWFIQTEAGHFVPTLIEVPAGNHLYEIDIAYTDGTGERVRAQINVGQSNWVSPPAEDEPIPAYFPLDLPVYMYVSVHPTVRGIPVDKVQAFLEELRTLYRAYEYVPPQTTDDEGADNDNGADAGDGSA